MCVWRCTVKAAICPLQVQFDNNVVFWAGFNIESFIRESTLAEKCTQKTHLILLIFPAASQCSHHFKPPWRAAAWWQPSQHCHNTLREEPAGASVHSRCFSVVRNEQKNKRAAAL